MVWIARSNQKARTYYIRFDNNNWIYIPQSSATDFASTLRDVALEAQDMFDGRIHSYDIERTFSYGEISFEYFHAWSPIRIHCNDGHWAHIPPNEAKHLVRLLRDEGF